MAELTGDTMSDPRLDLKICDVAALIDDANDGTCAKFDAILLDVDNGPDGMVRADNNRIYSRTGLGKARDALVPGGIEPLAVHRQVKTRMHHDAQAGALPGGQETKQRRRILRQRSRPPLIRRRRLGVAYGHTEAQLKCTVT